MSRLACVSLHCRVSSRPSFAPASVSLSRRRVCCRCGRQPVRLNGGKRATSCRVHRSAPSLSACTAAAVQCSRCSRAFCILALQMMRLLLSREPSLAFAAAAACTPARTQGIAQRSPALSGTVCAHAGGGGGCAERRCKYLACLPAGRPAVLPSRPPAAPFFCRI